MTKIKKIAPAETETIEEQNSLITNSVPQHNTIANFNVENLMAKAIENGLSPETMEKFLAMRMQLKAEWAREQYNKAMAAFQAHCPTIQKTKEVKDNSGRVLYSYAPIESIVNQVKMILQQHGFSYSTSMEVIPDGVKVCVKTIHIDGHSEESCMQVPLGNKTGIMSASQQTAAAQTFAKRYAFLNAFGILTGDEDNDGATIPEKNYTYGKTPGGTNYTGSAGITSLTEDDKAMVMFIKDLENCQSIGEWEQVCGAIKEAANNGKLSEPTQASLRKVAKKISDKLANEDLEKEKLLSPGMQKMQDAMDKAKSNMYDEKYSNPENNFQN